MLRDGFKTQPPVDRRFRPVPPSFYCYKQWQPPGTGRNHRSNRRLGFEAAPNVLMEYHVQVLTFWHQS